MLIENINQVITKYITNDIIRHMIQIASSEFCMILWSIKLKTIQTHINFNSTRNIQICFDNNYLLRNHDNGRVACATAVTQLSFVVLTRYGYITLIFWSPCTRVETWCVLFNFALLIFFTRIVVTLAEEVSRIVNNGIVKKCSMLEGFLFTRFKNDRKSSENWQFSFKSIFPFLYKYLYSYNFN